MKISRRGLLNGIAAVAGLATLPALPKKRAHPPYVSPLAVPVKVEEFTLVLAEDEGGFYLQKVATAMNRQRDQIILEALSGDRV